MRIRPPGFGDARHPVQRRGRAISTVRRPTILREALQHLATDPARPLAGGTDLLLDLHRGGPGPEVTVVDLTAIPELRGIDVTETTIRIGATTTHNEILRHPGLRKHALPLVQACLEIGSPQLRNRATLAGNLATASPANDSISALLALGATVTIAHLGWDGVARTRDVAVEDFFTGFRQTVVESGELITAISLPPQPPGGDGIWVKLGNRKAQAISVVHAGIVVHRDDRGVVETARIALGSVAATVVLLDEVAAALVGQPLTEASIDAAALAAAAAVSPISDVRATADYRLATIPTLIRRALRSIRDGNTAKMLPESPPCLGTRRETIGGRVVIDGSTPISVHVNGGTITRPGATASLLDWLRDEAGLSGSKEGCAEGECGACTVQLNGQAVMSCLVTAAQADTGTVITVEGLAVADAPHRVQRAFVERFAVQCGFCIPGFVVAAATMLADNAAPSDDEIELGLSGNLCRCTGYYSIRDAIRDAAAESRADGEP